MKALVCEGPRKVTVKEMPDAKIERPTDVPVKITTTNICDSDQRARSRDSRSRRYPTASRSRFPSLRHRAAAAC